jgi:hypothetical protein
MNKDDNVVELHPRQGPRTPAQPVEDSIVAAVMKLKEQPMRQVNWRAVTTFLAISMVAMASAALVPGAADAGIRWPAAMALVVSVLSAGAAMLYRYAPSFWIPLRIHRRPLRRPAS